MVNLKFRRVWTTIGYLLVGLVVVLSLTPSAPPPLEFPWEDKFKHMLAYGVLMLWFAQLHPRSRYGFLAAGFMLLGIFLELVQAQTGYRSGDIADAMANGLGTLLSWALAVKGVNNLFHQFENRWWPGDRQG